MAAIKTTFRYIVSFLLFISIFSLCTVTCVKLFLLSPNALLDSLEKNGYVSEVEAEATDAFENIGIPSGIPADVFTDVLPLNQAHTDIRNTVFNMFDGRAYTPNTQNLHNALYGAFMDYAKSIGAASSDGVTESLDELAGYCAEEYAKIAAFPFQAQFTSVLPKVIEVELYGRIALASLSMLTVMLLYFLNLHRKRRLWRDVGSGVITAGLAGILPSMFMLISSPISRMNLSMHSLRLGVQDYLNVFFTAMLACGIALVLLGGFMIIYSNIISRR